MVKHHYLQPLKNVSLALPSPQKEFFLNISQRLNQGKGVRLERFWQEELSKEQYNSLYEQDKNILVNLGFSLGKSGIDEQIKHISLTLNRLSAAEKESQQTYQKKR